MCGEVQAGHCWPILATFPRFFPQIAAIAREFVCQDAHVQKNPRVRKIRVRNSGAGNGCANFMDAWKKASVLQEKPCP